MLRLCFSAVSLAFHLSPPFNSGFERITRILDGLTSEKIIEIYLTILMSMLYILNTMDVDHILKMIVQMVERTVNFLRESVRGYYIQVILISNLK